MFPRGSRAFGAIRRVLLAFAFLAAGWPAFAQTGSIALTVVDSAGVARIDDPVTFGVPFPKGALLSGDAVALLDGGAELPVQTAVTSAWDDGSVRWLLVDSQVSLGANAVKTLSLEYGTPHSPVTGRIRVTPVFGYLEVLTGQARFRLSTTSGTLFDGVTVGSTTLVSTGSNSAGEVIADGVVYSSASDAPTVTVELDGPLRTVIRVHGTFRSALGPIPLEYTTRYVFYKGKSFVRVFHTLENPQSGNFQGHPDVFGPEGFVTLEGCHLRAKTLLTAPLTVTYGRDQGSAPLAVAPLAAGESSRLYQDSSGNTSPPGSRWHWSALEPSATFNGWKVHRGAGAADAPIVTGVDSVAAGRRASGWVSVQDGTKGLTVAVRHFWENYPKGLTVKSTGGVLLELWPNEWSVPHVFEAGRHKTHELLYYFHTGSAADARAEEVARAFQRPLFAAAPADWYLGSRAFDHALAMGQPEFTRYDRWNRAVIDASVGGDGSNIRVERERDNGFGWRNFGDASRGWDGCCDGEAMRWGNNEHDFQGGLFRQFARSPGDWGFLWEAEVLARHLRDVDVYHTTQDAPWFNGGPHKEDDYGEVVSGGPFPFMHGRKPQPSHAWVSGLLLHYHLFGEVASLEAAKEIGDWFVRNDSTRIWVDMVQQPERVPAWTIEAWLALYETTGDSYWLDHARDFVQRAIALQDPASGRHITNKPFSTPWQLGHLMDSFRMYYQVSGDSAVIGPAERYADFLLDSCVVDTVAHGGHLRLWEQWHIDGNHFEGTPTGNGTPDETNLNGLAFAFRLSGDPKYLALADGLYESRMRRKGLDYRYSSGTTSAKSAGFLAKSANYYLWVKSHVLANLPPAIDAGEDRALGEGDAVAFVVTAVDPEMDDLVFSAAGLPAGAVFDEATRSFAWATGLGARGDYDVVFSVSDGWGGIASDTVRFQVAPAPEPAVTALADTLITEGQLVMGVVTGSGQAFGGPLRYGATGLPAGAGFDSAGTRVFAWIPTTEQMGGYRIVFSVADTLGRSARDTTDILVLSDEGPSVDAGPDTTLKEGGVVQRLVSGSVPDGGPLAYRMLSGPPGSRLSPSTHVFQWFPREGEKDATNRAKGSGTARKHACP